MSQLVLFQPKSHRISLNAYLACALTGLNGEQRQLMFNLSDAVAEICKQYEIDLYEPRKQTDPVHHKEVKDADVFHIDRKRVLNSDLLIHLTHYPSTGSGEELDFAYSALIPIILISHSNSYVSRMITGIPSFQIHLKYTEPEELRQQLHDCLLEIRPILEERKLAFSEYDINIVGERIRYLREQLELSQEVLAGSIPGLTIDALAQIEENSDRTANPSLIQLRQIAAVLKTTVADLVEPDMEERIINGLNDWISGRQKAARYNLNIRDRNKIIRRILLRLIDSLENE
jgi:transcriptional regulator with XRE-family HTH domain